jgi:hypothetical protein
MRTHLRARGGTEQEGQGLGGVRVLFRWGVATLENHRWRCDDALGQALLDAVRGETPNYPQVDDREIARYAAKLLDGELLGPEPAP